MLELINRKIKFIIFLLLTNSSTAFCYLIPPINDIFYSIVRFVGYEALVCSWCIFVVLFASFVEKRYKKIARMFLYLLMLCSFVLFLVDIVLLVKFNSIFDQAKIEIVLGTSPSTVREFLELYLLDVRTLIYLIILCGIAYKVIKVKRADNIHAGLSYLLLALGAVGAVVFFFNVYRTGLFGLLEKNIYRGLLINRVCMDTYAAIDSLGDEERITLSFDNSEEKITENDSDDLNVIFVLGESVDRNKMSAYGYHLNNTPFLSSWVHDNEAYLFRDTIAPANYTTKAMELIFTFTDKNDQGKWYDNANIIDVAKKAGFHTAWISNQSPVGKYGNTDRILANRCDYYDFTSVEGGGTGSLTRPLDEEVLSLLDKAKSSDSNKNFYIIHLEGSHEVFSMRYPAEFNVFNENDEGTDNVKWNKSRAEYANSVLYTDYVLNEIIKRFKNDNAVVIYISDHGNDVYDDGRNFVGHSGENERSPHMVEVPMFIWGSQKYWSTHQSMRDSIIAAVNKPFMTDDMIYLFEDIMQIKSSSYKPEHSVVNSLFVPKRRIYGGIDYIKND
ncbi:heptose-I-phosphate ethanolaminephosphotransferase [Selenomonas sp. GACV-9]|uniref:phosphoethanolamine transferase n=1 Tax=Selenomonas sp. GACV-9 TaxID=3158782 RepID=UPI0008E3426C|nr:heptose-I-phosphate ethanolaminephosphotransferase [Selenomonas ruminantium]